VHHATDCRLVDGVFYYKTLVLLFSSFRFSLPACASTSSRINELLKWPLRYRLVDPTGMAVAVVRAWVDRRPQPEVRSWEKDLCYPIK